MIRHVLTAAFGLAVLATAGGALAQQSAPSTSSATTPRGASVYSGAATPAAPGQAAPARPRPAHNPQEPTIPAADYWPYDRRTGGM